MLPFDDRKPAAPRPLKDAAIIGDVQLPSERRAPAASVAERWKERCNALENGQVERGTQIRNREVVAAHSFQERWRDPDREPAAIVFFGVEDGWLPFAEPAGDAGRRQP